MTSEAEITEIICGVLQRFGAEVCYSVPVGSSTSLIDDIGLTSLRFVDLTVELEDALGIPEFPMQVWIDDEMRLAPGTRRFTVGSLVSRCCVLLAAS